MNFLSLPVIVTTVAAISFSTSAVAQSKKIVFLADGGKNSETHAHIAGNALLAKALEESGLGFNTSLHKGWPSKPKAFAGADSVVIYCNGGGGHLVMDHLDEFQELVDAGVGFVFMHYAVEVPKGRAGELMLEAMGGYFETDWSVNPHWTAEFNSLPEHPITRGVELFAQPDEWYYHMRFQSNMEGVTPILSAHPPQSTMNRKDGPHSNNPHVRKAMAEGKIQHVAWAYDRPSGQGRGFGTTGAHYHHTWNNDDWRTLILNAIAWTAGIEIPTNGIPSNPNPVKREK